MNTLASQFFRSFFLVSLLLFPLRGLGSEVPPTQNCRLRVMDTRELTLSADVIARVKVRKVKTISHPQYAQLANLDVVEMIKGDSRVKELNIWGMSKIYCALDTYVRGQEMLVFLVSDHTLYRTLNWQYGQFLLGEPKIKGWRAYNNDTLVMVERTYEEAKAEIVAYLESVRQTSGETPQNQLVRPEDVKPQP